MGAGGYCYLYNGKELNEDIGLYAYGYRYYDPAIGRFTGVDPIAGKFPNLSPYNYASNDPISHIDLHGLQGVNFGIGMMIAQKGQNGATDAELDIAIADAVEGSSYGAAAGLTFGAAVYGGALGLSAAGRYIYTNPELMGGLGTFLWGLGTDQDVPGAGDDVGKLFRRAAGELSQLGDDVAKKLLPYSDTDVMTLFRGTSGSEKSSSSIFLTDSKEVAESYIKNGGELKQYQVSRSGVQELEWDGKVTVRTGKNGAEGATNTEYQFTGGNLVEFLRACLKI